MTKEAFVALVTCFNDDETLNYAATRAQVRRQIAAGNNIMCAGTNGDFTALTFDEKVRLTNEVVDEVGGRARVIVNAGCPRLTRPSSLPASSSGSAWTASPSSPPSSSPAPRTG